MDVLRELQAWYKSHCDGDWEHQYGVQIDTLDNPGWSVTIDLVETELEHRPFDAIQQPEEGPDWIQCKVENSKFIGCCGPQCLEALLSVFLF